MENNNPKNVNGGEPPEEEHDSRADIEFVQDIPLKKKETEPPEPPELPRETPEDKVSFELYGWVQAVISTIVIVVLLFTFIVRVISVDGSSMYPTLYHGDRVLIVNSMLAPNYEYGDIVVLRKLGFSEKAIVKRVIATEGQTVNINFSTGRVYVDGQPLDEVYVNSPTNLSYDVTFPTTVPEGCIFVMGDNRNASADSRLSAIGMVDTRCVIGKAFLLCFPGGGEGEFCEGGMQFGRIGLLNGQE
jgi:signal peptidase I